MTLLTYYDAVEHLITSSFGGPQDAEQTDIRTAVQRAYTEISTIRDWNYYQTHGRIRFSTLWHGTVTYSSSTRQFTLVTGDAFPTNAVLCRMRIDNTVVKIAQRVSDTVLLCDPVLTPPVDITLPTTALLYQDTFPLPSDFRTLDSPIDHVAWTRFIYVSADQAMKLENANNLAGPPHAWTVIKDPASPGWAIKVIGYPVENSNLDFTYRRTPRRLRISGHEASSRQGTVTVNGTAVTGTGTAFTSGMVGSVMRFGTSTDSPGGDGSMKPYQSEAVIASVQSATSCTLATSVTATGALYLVSDIVEMSPGMFNGFLSCAAYWLARTRNTKPDNAFAMYQRDLRLAMEGDQLTPFQQPQRVIFDAMAWRTPLQADNFDAGNP
jgi:hypothetical protein